MNKQTISLGALDSSGNRNPAASSISAAFAPFSKKSKRKRPVLSNGTKTAIIYTRVSSKEQADKNLSLEVQKRTIEEYAHRAGFTIADYFGGTHESAKTDGRKEFQRMLGYIKKNKGLVSHILVYTLDRFSRTGGAAIQLTDELREKYGVTVYAVTQPIDTSNASGVLQETIQLAFARMDNELRKQRAEAGMKEQLRKGNWCVKPPIGYDVVRVNGERKIVVNETGRQIRKAFVWKSEGMKNEAILKKLRALGISIYKQKLSQMFDNPFYCGVINHSLLDGQFVEGKHEKLISRELFLSIRQIRQSKGGKFGVAHTKEREELPLKTFIHCGRCGNPFTGYEVKAKGLHYYKCRTKGCRCNRSAQKLDEAFADLLGQYSLPAPLQAPLLQLAHRILNERLPSTKEEGTILAGRLKEVSSMTEKLEERYFVGEEMSKVTYERLLRKYKEEQSQIEHEIQQHGVAKSNLDEHLNKSVNRSSDLKSVWISAALAQKEKLQRLVFPSAVNYDLGSNTITPKEVNDGFVRTRKNINNYKSIKSCQTIQQQLQKTTTMLHF